MTVMFQSFFDINDAVVVSNIPGIMIVTGSGVAEERFVAIDGSVGHKTAGLHHHQ